MKKALIIIFTLLISVTLVAFTGFTVNNILAGPKDEDESTEIPIQAVLDSINYEMDDESMTLGSILHEDEVYIPLSDILDTVEKKIVWGEEMKNVKIVKKEKIDIYNKENPVPKGVSMSMNIVDGIDNYTTEVVINEINRGKNAWRIINETNKNNRVPSEDEEYILAKIQIGLIESDSNKKIDISGYSFDLYSEDNVKYDDFIVIEPFPRLRTSLSVGQKHEGYVAFMVNKDDKNPKVVYEPYSNDCIWFSLGE